MIIRPWVVLEPCVIVACWRKFLMMVGLQENESPELSLPAPTMNLVGIGVSTSAQGRSAGHSLMGAFEAASHTRGMKSMCLSVYRSSTPARRSHEKRGWVSHIGASEDCLHYFEIFSEDGPSSADSSQSDTSL